MKELSSSSPSKGQGGRVSGVKKLAIMESLTGVNKGLSVGQYEATDFIPGATRSKLNWDLHTATELNFCVYPVKGSDLDKDELPLSKTQLVRFCSKFLSRLTPDARTKALAHIHNFTDTELGTEGRKLRDALPMK